MLPKNATRSSNDEVHNSHCITGTRKLSPRSLNADAAEVSTVIESANKNTSQKKNSTTSKTRGSLNKTIEKFKDDVRHRKSTLGNKDLLEGEGNDEDQGRRLKNAYNRARRLRMKQGEASRGRHKPLSWGKGESGRAKLLCYGRIQFEVRQMLAGLESNLRCFEFWFESTIFRLYLNKN